MSYFEWTGNPFVDTGIASILVFRNKSEPKEITIEDMEEIKKLLLSLYTKEKWVKMLNMVFTSNAHVTHNSAKTPEQKAERLSKHLDTFFQGILPLEKTGNCISCGRRNTVAPKNRLDLPLTGYKSSHFFSSLSVGADICETCGFAIQCAPLSFYACGKLAMLHSNSPKVLKVWSENSVKFIQKQIASGDYNGCFNEGFSNAENALFHIIQDLILSYEEEWKDENVALRLYHFTNFTQLPPKPLDIYDLPAPVFKFLVEVRTHPQFKDWLRVVKRGYYNIENKDEDEYRNYNNQIYKRLLNSQNILRYFVDETKKKAIGNWSLITIYLKEILFMDKKRIEAIRIISDQIADMIRSNGNGKKRLVQLEQAKQYAGFRNVLLRLVRDRVAMKAETPLITLEAYVDQLFPEGAFGWKETQDLVLFRLYEQLHTWLITQGIVIDEVDDETEIETTNSFTNN